MGRTQSTETDEELQSGGRVISVCIVTIHACPNPLSAKQTLALKSPRDARTRAPVPAGTHPARGRGQCSQNGHPHAAQEVWIPR